MAARFRTGFGTSPSCVRVDKDCLFQLDAPHYATQAEVFLQSQPNANLFQVPGRYGVSVTFAGDSREVVVTVRGVSTQITTAKVLHVGITWDPWLVQSQALRRL